MKESKTSLETFREAVRDIGVDHKEFISSLVDYQIGVEEDSIFKEPRLQRVDLTTTKCIAIKAEKPNGEPTIVEFHFDTGRNELITVRSL